MAEGSVSLPVTPDSTDSRRSSTGKLTASKEGEKIVPNYLRASTGSCHDFCKYGKKDASEAKERRPFNRKAIKKATDNDQHSPEIEIRVPSKPRTERNVEGHLLSRSAGSNDDGLRTALSGSRKASLPGRLRQSADSKPSRLRDSQTSPAGRLAASLDGKLSGLIDSSSRMKATSSRDRKKAAQPAALGTLPNPATNLASKTVKKLLPSSSLAKLKNTSSSASPRAKGLTLSEKLGSSFKPKLSSSNSNAAGSSARRPSDIGTGQKSSTLPKVALRKLQVSPKPLLSPRLTRAGLTARRQSDIGTAQKSSLLPKATLTKLQVSPKPTSSSRLASTARALASPRVSLSPKSSLAGVAGLNAKKNRAAKLLSSTTNDQRKTENKIKKAASNLQPKIQDKTKKEVATKLRTTNKAKEADNGMAEEKTLYVIKMETEDKHMESDLNERLDGDTSPPPVSSHLKPPSLPGCSSASSRTNEEDDEEEGSEYSLTDGEDESSYEYYDVTLEEQKKWSRRKGLVSSSGDMDPQPVKLRFRRGKVIEIKSENDDGPRRLKFRRRRPISEDNHHHPMTTNDGRARYRSSGGGDDDAVVDGVKRGDERVVLRHQDVDGRREGGGQGGLFNNVIEETASKLAETRKSKVKALVGAFETVISLQDVKPSGNVVVS